MNRSIFVGRFFIYKKNDTFVRKYRNVYVKLEFMKRFLLIFVVCFSLGSMLIGCQDEKSGEMSKEELQQELDRVKALLENNTKISNVVFEGNRMRLTFADGSVFETKVPDAIVPQIGSNGNWFVNGVDLGVSAEAKVPTIGSNGNWWVDGKDTGVQAQGGQGDPGEKGDPGMAIKDVVYDITTGILKIILTDGSENEYVLSASEGCMVGYLIKDLNGEFVLATIYNGDLPFAQFKYDAKNNLVEGEYYINVLNTPEKWLGFEQEFDANGKIQQQFIKEYAEIDKAMPVGDIFPEYVNTFEKREVIYTTEELFDEFFPDGIKEYDGEKAELMNRLASGYYYYNDNYVYYIQNYYNNDGIYSFSVIRDPRKTYITEEERGDKCFCLIREAGKVYLCTPYYSYYRDEAEYAYDETHWNPSFYAREYCDLSSVKITREYPSYLEVQFTKSEQLVNMSEGYRLPAVPYTDKVDEINGKELLDYFVPDPSKTLVEDGITGNYKALFHKFNLYNKGDEIRRGALNYVYSGDDYKVTLEGEEVGNVVMADGKVQEVVVVNEKKEKVKLLKFNYTGDLLTTIDAPYAEATEVAKVIYDNKNNPIEFQVNSSKLKGLGYEKTLCAIGLIYEYDYYDEEKGCVVRGYKYSEGYAPLLKIAYNYNLKNFMNHTLLAVHPILSLIQTNNAIEELIWAGHGSCFFAEYSDYNEGGYPQKVKGILHYAPFVNDDNIFEGQTEYPANGSVATMYRLKYEKKK